MKTITITLPTGKAGHVAYFMLNVKMENFLKVVELEFGSIENLFALEEKTKLFEIVK